MRIGLVLALALGGCGRLGFGDLADGGPRDADVTDASDAVAAVVCPALGELVACYEFDDTTLDSSLYGNHATAGSISYVPGVHGSALMINSGSFVIVSETPSIDIDMPITIETWIKPASLDTTRAVILDHDVGYAMFVRAGSFGASLQLTTGFRPEETPAVIPLGTWVHVAFTFDGTTVRFYVGGVEIAAAPGSSAPIATGGTNDLRLGGGLPSGEPMLGAIDELKIWRTVRTPAELCESAGC